MDRIKEIYGVDIKENFIKHLDESLLAILLKDRSSGKNIIWATDTYCSHGIGFGSQDQITPALITGKRGCTIKPRTEKSKREQLRRIKNKAEVFTPSWVCNVMANGLDEWFGRENVFNVPDGEKWRRTEEKISFPDGKTWQDYIKLRVLEITCGEAPFLTSRYDAVTGEYIDIKDRIGLLDRKLRIVSENVDSEPEWYNWAIAALKSVYGFDYQGDNVLIARENLLFAFIDAYIDKFDVPPIGDYLKEAAKILSWNIWQMDGLKFVIPNSCTPEQAPQISFFDIAPASCYGCESGDNSKHTGIYPQIKNWSRKKTFDFYSLIGGKNMKFDFVIGNPPYQETSAGFKKADDSVYHYFMDTAYEVGDKVMLITPARFLFDNGNTPAEWNRKMLQDEHFKVVYFEPVAAKIFPAMKFMGGVAIHYRDAKKAYGPLMQFTEFHELNSILKKVRQCNEPSLTTVMYNQNKFNLETLYRDYGELRATISSDGREKRLTSGCLIYPCFHDEKKSETDIEVLGLINNKRTLRFIERKYIEETHKNLGKFKVIIPANNGSKAIGAGVCTPVIGEPLVGEPFMAFTQTFISVGAFQTKREGENALKYIKSKFCRTMLGVLKVTQNGKRETWRYVPMQDFTEHSDIDWSKSIHEIDFQLYKKYGLDDKEISFIETHVKEMN